MYTYLNLQLFRQGHCCGINRFLFLFFKAVEITAKHDILGQNSKQTRKQTRKGCKVKKVILKYLPILT